MIRIFSPSSLALRGLVAASALLAASCGSNPVSNAVSGIFGGGGDGDAENAPAEDERISILALEETIEADPRLAGVSIELPPPYRNPSWPQPGGEADHTMHHLSGDPELREVWKVNIGQAGKRAVLTAPPVAADGLVYVVDAEAAVSAYRLENGERVWRTELAPEINERFRVREILTRPKASQIGFGGGVAIDAGRVFVTSGFGFAAALDAQTGEEVWRFETEAPVRTPPTADRGAVYFVSNTNQFYALSQRTGERLWDFASFEETARILSSASPAAAGDLVVAPFSSGEIVALLADSGRPIWNDTLARSTGLTSLATLNDIAGSPIIDRGLVYVVSHAGRLASIDIRTGERVWDAPIASLQMPWVAGDYIFVVSVDAELVCITREQGAVAWVARLPRYENEKKRKNRIAWAGPVLAGNHLILASTRGDIVKASPQDGAVIARVKAGEGFVVPPIVVDETVLALSQDGRLIALR